MIAVQARQSGWDPRAGSRFVVEFEQSDTPKFSTGFNRRRVWQLLDQGQREEALVIINDVARTLPNPDQTFVAALPLNVREHYLQQFAPTTETSGSADVWFTYYDEADAARWADFLSRAFGVALDKFLNEPPSFMGMRQRATPEPHSEQPEPN